jgi:hypothetical protein
VLSLLCCSTVRVLFAYGGVNAGRVLLSDAARLLLYFRFERELRTAKLTGPTSMAAGVRTAER